MWFEQKFVLNTDVNWAAWDTCDEQINDSIKHIELPAELLDYFLRSNKSRTNQLFAVICDFKKYDHMKQSE